MPLKEYKPGQAFPGVIGRTFDVSQPAWPAPNRAKPDAPNVLFIVLDDTGFGQLGFGASDMMAHYTRRPAPQPPGSATWPMRIEPPLR